MAAQLTSILTQQIQAGVKLVVGVEDEVQKLTSNFTAIKAVLEDAENRQVKENAVRDWLEKLQDVSYDIQDVLDEWSTEIQKLHMKKIENASMFKKQVRSLIPTYRFSPRQIVLRRKIAGKIKNLNETLDNISRQKDMFNFSLLRSTREVERRTTSFMDLSNVHGRDQDKNQIVDLLLSESMSSLPIISIVGMGGIGKTTLARVLYHDDRVNTHFDKKIWVCVSDPFDEIRIAKAILESLQGDAINLVELETLLQKISEKIAAKKFFLVFDDVWTEDPTKWEQLRNSLTCGSQESRILLTTRKENVAKLMGTTNMITLGKLAEEECWLLFSQVAFFGRTSEQCDELEDVGRKIVSKCNGLPLAVKTIASLLSLKTKIEQWQLVLDSEMWQIEEIENCVFAPLLLSYYDLPSNLKKCFSYCAIFPKHYEIEKDMLLKLWMAQGYLKIEGREDMELVGEEYFEKLVMRSFFQDFKMDDDGGSIKSCEMHDIVHDFAQFLTKNECSIIYGSKSPLNFGSKNTRHTMMISGMVSWFPMSIFESKKLRSLMVNDWHTCRNYNDITILIGNLTCLRVIDWVHYPDFFTTITRVSKRIGKLKHLRYLRLIGLTSIKELPDEFCDLYNLQTLDISDCDLLERLPENIGKLINLRHLINRYTGLRYMPKGIERLTCLRTLGKFVLTDDVVDGKTGTLECLKDLNSLQGSLALVGLANVTDVGEAEKADLKSKINLFHLELQFFRLESTENDNDEHVLEALQPPPNLKTLDIRSYGGTTLSPPSWTQSLAKLRELNVGRFDYCDTLAGFGKLPSLESLSLVTMGKLERVGIEFLGIDGNVGRGGSSSSSSSSSSVVAFPKLKRLEFKHLDNWEEWDYGIIREDIAIMPLLDRLSISKCPKLKTLPDHLLQRGIFLGPNDREWRVKWPMEREN